MTGYLRAPGVLMAPLGEGWVVFSALSGETHLVNAESVEVLDALSIDAPRTAQQICDMIAVNYELPAQDLMATLRDSWEPLVAAGLVREATVTQP